MKHRETLLFLSLGDVEHLLSPGDVAHLLGLQLERVTVVVGSAIVPFTSSSSHELVGDSLFPNPGAGVELFLCVPVLTKELMIYGARRSPHRYRPPDILRPLRRVFQVRHQAR